MAGYIPRTGGQKKKGILAQREDELRHHILHKSCADVIQRSAKRVRAAQLGVFKALLYETEPARADDTEHHEFRASLARKQAFWTGIQIDEIIRRYQSD